MKLYETEPKPFDTTLINFIIKKALSGTISNHVANQLSFIKNQPFPQVLFRIINTQAKTIFKTQNLFSLFFFFFFLLKWLFVSLKKKIKEIQKLQI